MNWKFWKKGSPTQENIAAPAVKPVRPKELPDPVGRYLVTQLKQDPDWVWSLKAVLRPRTEPKQVFDIRLFDPADARRLALTVRDYHTLEAHPELILYSGLYDKKSGSVQIEQSLPEVA